MTTPAGPVVVGVDGSDHSRHALRWAAFLAGQLETSLAAVAAWDYPLTYGYAALPTEWDPAADMRTMLDEAVAAVFGPQPPPGLTRSVRRGGAAEVLLEASRRATMLVVGSRGHGGFAGLLLGSVSAHVAEHASCPVLIVHGDQPAPAPRS